MGVPGMELVIHADCMPQGEHACRFNTLTTEEIAVLIVGGLHPENPFHYLWYDLRVQEGPVPGQGELCHDNQQVSGADTEGGWHWPDWQCVQPCLALSHMLPSQLCKKLAHLGTKQEEEEHSVSESIDVKNTKEIIELIVIYWLRHATLNYCC